MSSIILSSGFTWQLRLRWTEEEKIAVFTVDFWCCRGNDKRQSAASDSFTRTNKFRVIIGVALGNDSRPLPVMDDFHLLLGFSIRQPFAASRKTS
jgi:hypothetical protein